MYALRVAVKDRPKTFRHIVVGLFYMAVTLTVLCLFTLLEEEQKKENGDRGNYGQKREQQPAYTVSTVFRH